MENSVASLEKGKLYDVVEIFNSTWGDGTYKGYRLAPGKNKRDFFITGTEFENFFYTPEETINILRSKNIEKMLDVNQ